MSKEIIIDGNSFETLEGFYNEVERKLTKGLDWKIGRNLDSFNDVLWGGFGVHDNEEPLKLYWKNAAKSRRDLGQGETEQYLNEKLKRCHPSNASFVKKELQDAKAGKGKMVFDILLDIIKEHDHIQLQLE
jgi:RNAse (barnase) inhibitor barstar